MPDYRGSGTKGRANLSLGPDMAQDTTPMRNRRFAGGGQHRTLEQNPFLAKMENPGIVGTSGAASNLSETRPVASEPQQLATPDVVSAQDPAYSMHPLLKALSSAGGVPAAPVGGSPFQMLGPEFKGKGLTKAQLLSALGMPGLDYGIKTQGEAL